jgi:hypothetical protein
MGMKSSELVKIDDWIKELNSGSLNEKEKSKLLLELKSELQKESEALDRLSNRINILEEELLKRLPFKIGDHAIAKMDDGEKIGQISELHTITLPTGIIIVALSPHFYPEYMCDIDKIRKPTSEEILNFETNRSSIESEIKRREVDDTV